MEKEELIDYLIEVGEAVEYGERWTGDTTHEWWWTGESRTERDYRMVATYHGTGARGDDDEAEYVQRLRDLGRAVLADPKDTEAQAKYNALRYTVGETTVTHVIVNGKAVRIRNYFEYNAPKGVV